MPAPASSPPSRVRIIGGRWRRRQLPIADADELRPTPIRLRQTLFDWLAAWLPGRRCADLFAGSGALGVEALSRGAAEALFVDSDAALIETLRRQLRELGAGADGAGRAQTRVADAARVLIDIDEPYDLIFFDPPFSESARQLRRCLPDLRRALHREGFLYLETARDATPPDWRPWREWQGGRVRGALYRAAVIK